MWFPPERIRHRVAPAAWPSADEASRARWFSPLTLGPRTARTRTWVPAMVPWRATDDGQVTPAVLAWYERFAAGRPGVLVVEATGVRDVPSGPLLRIGDDRFVPGLSRLVETVRRASGGETLLFIQCIDFLSVRRRPERDKYLGRFLALRDAHRAALTALDGDAGWASAGDAELRSRLAALDDAQLRRVLDERELESLERGYRERVTDVHLPHVADLPRTLPTSFADAAARAEAAGFDGIELHYAHAYTMASMLSALNTRTDGYGGTRQGRVRLPLEVLAAVRARVPGLTVGLRLLGDEVIAGGSRVDDAAWFSVELARAGADFISVSKGGKFEDARQPKLGDAVYPYTGPSGYECMPTVTSDARGPFARNVELAATIKRALIGAGLTTLVVTAGGINDFAQAEAILARGDADIVAAARQSLADPDWFEKIRVGRGDEVRRCEYTNYCEALDQRHVPVTCKLWDRKLLDEPGVQLDPTGHRRLTPPIWRRS